MHEARYRNATASAESSHRIGAGKPFPVPSLPPHHVRTGRASIDALAEMVKVEQSPNRVRALTSVAALHVHTMRHPAVPLRERMSLTEAREARVDCGMPWYRRSP